MIRNLLEKVFSKKHAFMELTREKSSEVISVSPLPSAKLVTYLVGNLELIENRFYQAAKSASSKKIEEAMHFANEILEILHGFPFPSNILQDINQKLHTIFTCGWTAFEGKEFLSPGLFEPNGRSASRNQKICWQKAWEEGGKVLRMYQMTFAALYRNLHAL